MANVAQIYATSVRIWTKNVPHLCFSTEIFLKIEGTFGGILPKIEGTFIQFFPKIEGKGIFPATVWSIKAERTGAFFLRSVSGGVLKAQDGTNLYNSFIINVLSKVFLRFCE